jgi:hypothetical protein
MLEAKLPNEYYGNWARLVDDWRAKNGEQKMMLTRTIRLRGMGSVNEKRRRGANQSRRSVRS